MLSLSAIPTGVDAGSASAIAYPLIRLFSLVAAIVLLASPAANDYFRKAPSATGSAGSSPGLGWLKIVGGVLAAVGVLLPWVDYGFTTYNGLTLDGGSVWGALILVLGLVIASISSLQVSSVHVASVVLSALLAVAAVARFSDVVVTSNYPSLGPGIFFVLIGALAALIGSLLALRSGLSR